MTPFVRKWVEGVVPEFIAEGSSVVEIGSLDINGGISDLLSHCDYIGVDKRQGPGVDMVIDALDLSTKFPCNSLDAVFCLETLEHVDRFWLVLNEIWQVLKPQGLMILSVPTFGFRLHREPKDYWRFGRDSIEVLLSGFKQERVDEIQHGLALVGRKS